MNNGHPITPFPLNPKKPIKSSFYHISIIVIFLLIALFVIINFKAITKFLNKLYDKYFLKEVPKNDVEPTPIFKALDLQPQLKKNPKEDDNEFPNGKKGFCYIGEQKGVRSCIGVGINDTCMSGEIFPSMDKCINPNIR